MLFGFHHQLFKKNNISQLYNGPLIQYRSKSPSLDTF